MENLPQAPRMSRAKKVALHGAIGAVLAAVLASVFVPRLLTWYFEPPVITGCSCAASIAWALEANRWIQLFSLLIGAGLGCLLAFRIR